MGEPDTASASPPTGATRRRVDPRTPCVIGVGARTWRDQGEPAPEPLEMWQEVAELAAADAGDVSWLRRIDSLAQVHCMSWDYEDGPALLAQRLGAEPRDTRVSMLAGTAGQRMLDEAAERMLRGEVELALVVGAEALATRRRLHREGAEPAWSNPAADPAPALDLSEWFWPTEWVHDVIRPTLTFAALDTARRRHVGLDPLASRAQAAALVARFSEVASTNPTAWFGRPRTADEVATVTAGNRVICSPYTKLMNAIMDVDMAAGVLLSTHEMADRLGVPRDRRVYLRSWSFGRDAVHLAQRPFLHRSNAMKLVAEDVLTRAGVGVDDVEFADLYSCFPSSVLFAADALGISPSDERPCTVAGGLACHGGPGSNYTTHAVVALVRRLREADRACGLLTGVGMHMTKHVWALYGTDPGPVCPPDYGALQARIDEDPVRRVGERVDRRLGGEVGCYSVVHDRAGAPASAFVVADADDGLRYYARSSRPDVLAALGSGEWVGARVRLRPGAAGTNEFEPAERP